MESSDKYLYKGDKELVVSIDPAKPEEVTIWQVGGPEAIPGDIACFNANGSYSLIRPEKPKEDAEAIERMNMLTIEGRQLVHNIYVRKGNKLLMNKAGTRMKPIAQTIFAKNMAKLRAGVSPVDIVADLEAQLKLI